MKPLISFIVGYFPALSSTFILNQITGLLDRGFDVRIFALKDPKDSRVHPDYIKYNLKDKTEYFSVPENKLKRISGSFNIFFKNIKKHPGKIIKCFNPFLSPAETMRLNTPFYLKPFLSESPDIIFSHFGPNGLIGSILKDLGIQGKLITIFHGYDISSYLLKHTDNVYAPLFKNGDLFLPVNKKWADKLRDIGCPANRIQVMHLGIDINRFRNLSDRSRSSNLINLLTIGRLVEKKGHETVLRALAKISEQFNWNYTIAGDGPLRNHLEDLTIKLGLNSRVLFSGPVNEDEVLDLYSDSDIFLLPSITGEDGDSEGIPMVLMEAMSMELPVISTVHSGIPELVDNEINGFLVNERDYRSISSRILQLAGNKELRKQMGTSGRKKVESSFNLAKQNDKLAGIINNFLES